MIKRRKKLWLSSSLIAAALPLAFAASASAADCNGGAPIELKDASGAAITDGVTPYSPKQTCGGCHDYGSGSKAAHKTQGVLDSDGTGGNGIFWQSYEVHGFAHGAVVGRHSQQGRNEDYSIQMKNAYGDPFFTSSPGMYGKY